MLFKIISTFTLFHNDQMIVCNAGETVDLDEAVAAQHIAAGMAEAAADDGLPEGPEDESLATDGTFLAEITGAEGQTSDAVNPVDGETAEAGTDVPADAPTSDAAADAAPAPVEAPPPAAPAAPAKPKK